MRIFNLGISQAVVRSFGLNYPEKFELHAFTRTSALLGVYNFVTGSAQPYLVLGYKVHISAAGMHLLYTGKLDLTHMRSLLQEAERSRIRAFIKSLKGARK